MDSVIRNSDGKPVFIGQDEFNPSPVKRTERSGMVCQLCGKEVPYLVGENTPDGGLQGCELCWRPGKGVQHERQEAEETVFD